LDGSAHASLAASCEELRAMTGNPPLPGTSPKGKEANCMYH
jgi:hypothetical protein